MEDTYRVVHGHDLVAHVPPCIPKLFGKSSCIQEGILPYYPYHAMTEVFYRKGYGASFHVCESSEDRKCSNSLIDLSIDEHTHYFDIPVGQAWVMDLDEVYDAETDTISKPGLI